MKNLLPPLILCAGLLLAAGVAQAQKQPEAIAREAGCLGCHSVASKKIGPSFRDVAKKHGKQGEKIYATLKADKEHADQIKDLDAASLKALADWVASQ